MIIKYCVKIGDSSCIGEDLKSFKKFIKTVIHDAKGMRVLFGHRLKLEEVECGGESVKMTINLVTNNDVERICGFNLLSCADRTNGNVYLNWTRWSEGSQIFFDGLQGKYAKLGKRAKMDLYRTYVVNHEILHILGFIHPEKHERFDKKNCSIMCQQTINLQGGQSWWWPVKRDKKYFQDYTYI